MSKQVGLIKMEGTIGGVAFYQSGGQHLARIANGPSKEQIATLPSFIRTRENNSEFGGSAHAAKSFRTAFASSVQTMKDSRLTSRLTRLFKEICDKNVSGFRGRRSILVKDYPVMFKSFEFNKLQSFGSVFNAPFTFGHSPSRDKMDVTVQNLIASSFIHAPAGATHFKLIMAGGVVSNYVYDQDSGSYEPVDFVQDGSGSVESSALLSLTDPNPQNVALNIVLPFTPSSDVLVIQALGIEFYQKIGTNDYLLAQGNAMKIVDAF